MTGRVTVYKNIDQGQIVITEDKVRLTLIEHHRRMEASDAWITPAGLLATLLITLVTADFHSFVLPGTTWQAVFVVAAFICVIWLINCLRKGWGAPTVDDVVDEMKALSGTPHPPPTP